MEKENENRMMLLMTCFDGKVEWHVPKEAFIVFPLPSSVYAKLKAWLDKGDDVDYAIDSHGNVWFINNTIIERHKAKKKEGVKHG